MISENQTELKSEFSFEGFQVGDATDRLTEEALHILESTSRTFFIPISRLPGLLLAAVASGYLCMRAIDEIEDHPDLDNKSKELLLRSVSRTLQSAGNSLRNEDFLVTDPLFRERLPEVTVRLGDWVRLAPSTIAARIWDATAAMADRMASWVVSNWAIQTEADLDSYTFGVAGAVGLMLSDIWAWYDGTRTDRFNAIGFGRGLQSVNILRNREADQARGVDFFPWGGLLLTFLLTVTGIVFSFPLGILLALGRRSRLPAVRGICITYIEVIRGVPLVTILFMAQVMLPFFLSTGTPPDRVLRAIAGITLFSAAYLAENVRGGLQAVPQGQYEAAYAVGLSGFKTMVYIILPQALRTVIPVLVGQFISLFKDTTLVSIVGLLDLLGISRSILAQPQYIAQQREVLLFITAIYWVFSYLMAYVSQRLEISLGVGER